MAALPFRARWLGALVLAFVLAVPAAIHPAPAGSEGQSRGSIYLFLGGVGGIFSTGLDDLRDELRAHGVPATALSYVGWRSVADQIEAGYAADKRALPVVIVGHSFGGDAALRVSAELGRHGIPVALVVIFDATNGTIPVAANVRHLINYYSDNDMIGKKLSPGPGFRGQLENIDVDELGRPIFHFNIEKQPAFHQRVIGEIVGVYGAAGARASNDD
jgi:hypothetical protein